MAVPVNHPYTQFDDEPVEHLQFAPCSAAAVRVRHTAQARRRRRGGFCLFVCLITELHLSCGGRPPARDGPYTTSLKAGRGSPGQDQETDPTPKGTRGIWRISNVRLESGLIYAPSREGACARMRSRAITACRRRAACSCGRNAEASLAQ